MLLAKGYFKVGCFLSKFSIVFLSTLALSILFFSPSTNASSSLDSFISDNSVDRLEFCGIDISNRLFTVVFNNLDGSLSNEIVYDPEYHTINSDQSYVDRFKESMKSENGSWAFVKIDDNNLRIIHSTGRMTATLGNLPIHYSQGYNIYRDTLVVTNSTQPITHIDLSFSCDQTPKFRFINNSDIYNYLSDYGSYRFWYSLANPPYYLPSMSNFSSKIYLFTGDVIYPQEYEGIVIDGEDVDTDRDGLTWVQERQQGTLDSSLDTDGDGINDFIESIWFDDRDEVFCNTDTVPYECAYPTPITKDLYVEVDWMHDGTRSYRPSDENIQVVAEMFKKQDIIAHFDTGQYGGGQKIDIELSDKENKYLLQENRDGMIDYYDYKHGGNKEETGTDKIIAHFSAKRNFIWRYMISGYGYATLNNHDQVIESSSSGWAQTFGSDSFISTGLIIDMQPSQNVGRSVAGTIAHELGHNLCLSPARYYKEQPKECVYEGIDNSDTADPYYNLENYKSVMNYRYQFYGINPEENVLIDYSFGSSQLGDHDDWLGVKRSINGFSGTTTLLGNELPTVASHKVVNDKAVINEPSPEELIQHADPEINKKLDEKRKSDTPPTPTIDSSEQPGAPVTDTDNIPQTNNLEETDTTDNSKPDWITLGMMFISSLVVIIIVGILYISKKNSKK